jgi:hypothetical protein
MTCEDCVYVANVVIIDSTQNTMTMSVISQLASVAMELITIVKICKYRRLHEGHHFILMAMEVHGAFEHDMDCLIKECVRIFHNR